MSRTTFGTWQGISIFTMLREIKDFFSELTGDTKPQAQFGEND